MADGAQQALDHLALGGDHDHALARALGRLEDAERVEVQDGARERHRHLILGLEAHRGGELLAIDDGGQLERAQHGSLIGQADPHALAQTSVAEELAQRLAEGALVEHLALAQRVGCQRGAGGVLDGDPPVDVGLHRGDVAGLDVQADEAARATSTGEPEVGCFGLERYGGHRVLHGFLIAGRSRWRACSGAHRWCWARRIIDGSSLTL